jgi:SAM-dependent methyltransferase
MRPHVTRRLLLTLGSCAFAASALAQTPQTTAPFEPSVGQPGKDVVWVPTSNELVAKMLDMAKVTPRDFVIDLGSGDGRTVIAAAKRGARALGIEFNPDMVELSKRNAAEQMVADRATFIAGDLFEADLTQATVITMFLLPDINLRLRPTLLDLKPGTRVVSNTFTMDDWEADETGTLPDDVCNTWCNALLWIVPAKAGGTWRIGKSELTLTQEFQMLNGTLTTGSTSVPIANGRLRGDEIVFSAGGTDYTGRVSGSTMQGKTTGAASGNWSATRVAP